MAVTARHLFYDKMGVVAYDVESWTLFTIQNGVKQGCILVLIFFTFFSMLLIFAIRQSEEGVYAHKKQWKIIQLSRPEEKERYAYSTDQKSPVC